MRNNFFKMMSVSLIVIAVSLISYGCSDYFSDVEGGNPIYGTIGTYQKTSNNQVYFLLDDGLTMGIVNAIEIPDSMIGKRFFMDFQYVSENSRTDTFDSMASLLNIQQVVTKPILDITTKEELDSMGVNKINPSWVWCSSHYMNIVYYVMGSNSIPHMVNLIDNEYDPIRVSGDTLVFELRHNAYNDPPMQQLRGVGSFDLTPYMESATDTVLKIMVYYYSFYQGTSSVYLTYDFKKDEVKEVKMKNEEKLYVNRMKEMIYNPLRLQ